MLGRRDTLLVTGKKMYADTGRFIRFDMKMWNFLLILLLAFLISLGWRALQSRLCRGGQDIGWVSQYWQGQWGGELGHGGTWKASYRFLLVCLSFLSFFLFFQKNPLDEKGISHFSEGFLEWYWKGKGEKWEAKRKDFHKVKHTL